MACVALKLPGGGTAIVCGLPRNTKRCCVCGSRLAEKLCDYKLRGPKTGKTCDRPLCVQCADHREPDTDYCPTHGRMVAEQKALF